MPTRFGRFSTSESKARFGRIDGFTVRFYDAPPWRGGKETGQTMPLATLDRVCPVAPSKIVCIGRNYKAHAKEMGNDVPKEPLLFLKPPSSLLEPGGTIRIPRESERVEHEVELGVVIGTKGRYIPVERAMGHVFGYTVVGDITARDLQKKDGQWTRAKGFDSFCPVGPEVVTDVFPGELALRCRVNGVLRQDGNTRDMLFGVSQLISYVSQVMTLEPGDLIATGTPEGVGPIVHGDTLELEIEQVGLLRLSVRVEKNRA